MDEINIGVMNYSLKMKEHILRRGIEAVQFQLDRHFKAMWNKTATIILYNVRVAPPQNSWQIIIVDNEEKLKSLGYKDRTKTGKPLSFLFLDEEDKKCSPWSVEFSRLVLTMIIDPELKHIIIEDFVVETYEDKPSKIEKYGFSYDVCSPCQGFRNAYTINHYYVSDFITPSWFISKTLLSKEDTPSFDYNNLIDEPFGILDDGFAQIYDFSQNEWTFLKGENTDNSLIELKPHSMLSLRIKDKNSYEKSKI